MFFYRNFPRATFQMRRWCNANYEREMELLDTLCDRERTGIDVGAKVGAYTYRIRDRSSDVLAFEPIPLFHQMLFKVFQGRRARIENCAVSRTAGTAVLRVPYDHRRNHRQFGRSTIEQANSLTNTRVHGYDQIEVQTRTIDSYELPQVGFMKIDVEGHELAVLEGAQQTIAQSRPNMLIECNDEHQPDGVARLASWMAAARYDAYFMFGGRLHAIADYDRELHWTRHGIENFICISADRTDVHDAVAARAARVSA
jgi:FkbM family methyltransferase